MKLLATANSDSAAELYFQNRKAGKNAHHANATIAVMIVVVIIADATTEEMIVTIADAQAIEDK